VSTIQAARKVAVKQQHVRQKEQPKPKRNLKSVEEKRRQSRSAPEISFPVFVITVSIITVGMIINVAQQALVSQMSYQTELLKKDIQVAQQIHDKLLAEKAILESPQRVESIATNKLSMVKAPKVSYLRIAGVQSGIGQASARPVSVSLRPGGDQ
jgi:cell division protein FtsL